MSLLLVLQSQLVWSIPALCTLWKIRGGLGRTLEKLAVVLTGGNCGMLREYHFSVTGTGRHLFHLDSRLRF